MARRFIINAARLAQLVFREVCTLQAGANLPAIPHAPTPAENGAAKIAIYNYLTPPFLVGANIGLPATVPVWVEQVIIDFLAPHRDFLEVMPWNNLPTSSVLGEEWHPIFWPTPESLGYETFVPITILPTNSTTAQPIFIGMDYRVLVQYIVNVLQDPPQNLPQGAVHPLPYVGLPAIAATPHLYPPGQPGHPTLLVAQYFVGVVLPAVTQAGINPRAHMGHIEGPNHEDRRRELLHLFFDPTCIKWPVSMRTQRNASYFVQSDGRGFRWTFQTNHDDLIAHNAANGANPLLFVKTNWHDNAHTLGNNIDFDDIVDWRRGIYMVDKGILNLDLNVQINNQTVAVEDIIGVDPGIRHVITSTNRDIGHLINQGPPPPPVGPVPPPPPVRPPQPLPPPPLPPPAPQPLPPLA
ncbi:hypothetical protein BDR26DRAFT_896475 [Obelidium mucronatum]|nr:hypothetical protein BDR26DRAFT_896475 [Obelidium mucronatum]